MNGFLLASVICIIVATIIDATSDPQSSIIFLTLYRTEEFGAVFNTLLFLGKKKPIKVASFEEKSVGSTLPLSNTISVMPSGTVL
jgi:hypothetical protein